MKLTGATRLAFDLWLAREFPGCPFERYADDGVVHCRTRAQAEVVLAALRDRMEQVGVRLHPDKTRIVYCKDGKRRGSHEHTEFTFLGFTFRARAVRARNGNVFTGFSPAASKDAIKKMSERVKSWRLHTLTGHGIGEVARAINSVIRGWMQYYGAFYKTALYPLLRRINSYLVRWDAEEVQAAEALQESARGMETGNQPVPDMVRALAVGPRILVRRMRRAR